MRLLPKLGSAGLIVSSLLPIAAAVQAQTSGSVENNNAEQVIDNIIVTATRREQTLTEVPIALSVVSSEDIAQTGSRELAEISEYIPNVSISDNTDFRAVITIRGVGSESRNIGFDSRVGVYVDGVYMGQSPAVNQELLDLERVEVLRGPQGMLFGKNTVAGAISLVTRKPDEELAGKLSASVGNFNYRELQGMINLPLSETLAAKVAVSKTDRDGFVDNLTTGNELEDKDVQAWRAQLRFTPSDQLEVNLALDGFEADSLVLAGEPLTNPTGTGLVAVAPEPRVVAFDFDPFENREVSGAMLDVNYEFDSGFTLKSITGFRDTEAFYSNATDYAPISIIFIEYTDQFEQLSQEFQFISPDDGDLTYMLGLYYYEQEAKTKRDAIMGNFFYEGVVGPLAGPIVAPLLGLDPNNLTPDQLNTVARLAGFGPEGTGASNVGTVDTKSFAAYFNGSYDFDESWTLGFGLRFSTEEKDVNWLLDGINVAGLGIGSTNVVNGVPTPLINDRSDDFLSVALSLSYSLDDNSNLYVKYSSGYKSGGFNLDFINADELAANSGLEFDKETVDSFEIGYKTTGMDGRATLNLAAFYTQYDDYQVNQFVDLGGGRTSIRITNAAKVISQGLEAEFSFQASENFSLQGSAGWLDAEFDSFPGGGAGGADVTGNRLTLAPEITAALGLVYEQDLSSLGGTLLARLDLTYTDSQFTTEDNVTTTTLPSGDSVPFGSYDEYTLLNGRIGLIDDDGRYEVYLWGRNLADEDYLVDDFRDFFGTIVNHPNIGRTYGAEIVFNF